MVSAPCDLWGWTCSRTSYPWLEVNQAYIEVHNNMVRMYVIMRTHDSCVGLFAVLLTLFLSSVCVVVGSFTLMREAAANGE